jgi:hypothetical protein
VDLVLRGPRDPGLPVSAARGPQQRERGFALIIFALMLFSLLVITALVVDLGAVYAHRRNDQNAADAAALAGAQELPDMAAAVTAIKQYTNQTLDIDLVNSDWNRCADDDGALPLVAPNNNCISFNPARTRVRVRIPDQEYETFFASVAGVDTIRHSAFAIAGIRNQGFGSVLPFGLPGGAGFWDGYVCLKSAPNGQTQPPCGSHSGNFGYLDFSYFGNEDLGTDGYDATYRCGSGRTQDRIENNLAVGVDHTLSMAPGPDGFPQTEADTDACFQGGTEVPDNAWTQTGVVDMVDVGLFTGDSFTDGNPARLRRLNTIYPAQVELRNDMVENVPLWTYIPTSLNSSTDIPASCRPNQFDDLDSPFNDLDVPSDVRTHLNAPGMTVNDRSVRLLRRCFAHYQGRDWSDSFQESVIDPPEPRQGCAEPAGSACTTALFTANTTTESPDLFDIQFSPRFAYVPSVWTPCEPSDEPDGPELYYECLSDWASGTDRVSFRSFQSIYIQRATFGSGNANNVTYWDAGFDDAEDVNNNADLREITGFAFESSMLPGDLGAADAPFRFGSNLVVRLVR